MSIGNRLKQVRESLSLDRKKMAALVEMKLSGYSKYEKEMNFPSIKVLNILASKLDISMDWMLFGRGPAYFKEKAPPAEGEQTILERLEKMMEADAEVNAMIGALVSSPVTKHQFLAEYHRLKSRE